jgi:hypothetical protein
MMTNIENNGAPWHNQQDRLNWKWNFFKVETVIWLTTCKTKG